MAAIQRLRIWEVAQKFTKDILVSVVSDVVVALPQESANEASAPIVTPSGSDSLFCTSCKVTISDNSHYKTDWHRLNTKLKMAGARPISQAQFESLTLDDEFSDEEEYVEERAAENTASPSASLEVQASTGSARIAFITKTNEMIAIWKSTLLAGKSNTLGQYAAATTRLSLPLDPCYQKATSVPTIQGKNAAIDKTVEKPILPSQLRDVPLHPFQSAIFLCQGGFFAGAVFRHDTVLKHKRIARYTVRRKQGGSQASKDATKGGIHSAGASIRRYNESKLREEIAELMEAWKLELAQCSVIFLHAPSFNSASFFFEGSPLSKRDPRVRHIPIVTHRPSFVELQRIHDIMFTVEVSPWLGLEPLQKQQHTQEGAHTAPGNDDSSSLAQSVDTLSSATGSLSLTSSSSSVYSLAESDFLETEEKEVKKSTSKSARKSGPDADVLLAAVAANDLEEVKRLLIEENYVLPFPENPNELVYPMMIAIQANNEEMLKCLLECGESPDDRSPKYEMKTVLHVACEKALDHLVLLLLEEGANPVLTDQRKRTPFEVCKDKNTKTLMRRFAGANPDLWDYAKCRLPPLTDEIEAEENARAAEAQARELAAQEEKQKKQAEADEKKRQAEEARQRKKAQEEEEKKARAAEDALAREAALERTKKMLTMSEREKRALAAERRLNPKANTCDNCGKPITGQPFEKFSFKYCSTGCIVEHKRVLDTLQASSSK